MKFSVRAITAMVQPVTRFEQRDMQPGPISKHARELYWAFCAANQLNTAKILYKLYALLNR